MPNNLAPTVEAITKNLKRNNFKGATVNEFFGIKKQTAKAKSLDYTDPKWIPTGTKKMRKNKTWLEKEVAKFRKKYFDQNQK